MNTPSLIRRSRSNVSLLPVCAPPQTKSSTSTMRVVLSLFGVALMCLAGLAGSGTPVPQLSDVDAANTGADTSQVNVEAGASARLLSAELNQQHAATATATVLIPDADASLASASTAATSRSDSASASATEAVLSTTKAAAVPCQDVAGSALCERWASLGECTTNVPFMATKCPKSCGQCVDERVERDNASRREGSSGERLDKNKSCQQWAQRGECTTNPSYMLHNCPAACASAQGHDES